MDTDLFERLTPDQQTLVCVAVLLDGFEGGFFLRNDKVNGEVLERLANDLAMLNPDLRMPFIGTLLRKAVSAL